MESNDAAISCRYFDRSTIVDASIDPRLDFRGIGLDDCKKCSDEEAETRIPFSEEG
jgi:hypothetical protein